MTWNERNETVCVNKADVMAAMAPQLQMHVTYVKRWGQGRSLQLG